MTKLLEEAFEAASNLSEADQDFIATLVMDEIESERRWDELFAKSQDALERMGDYVLAQHLAGKSRPMDFDAH
jgi:hypothetical protein